MNLKILGAALLLAAGTVHADMCVVPKNATAPLPEYAVLKKLRASKHLYGGLDEVRTPILEEAYGLGADAVVQYEEAQSFGIFPWMWVHPIARGAAVRFAARPAPACESLGGQLYRW